MKLLEIREIAVKLKKLKDKIDSFSPVSAITYDGVRVQTSPKQDGLEKMVIQREQAKKDYAYFYKVHEKAVKDYNIEVFTPRQQALIRCYFFEARKQVQCCDIMGIKPSAISQLKYRVLDREHDLGIG